jgi:hypothetical protein
MNASNQKRVRVQLTVKQKIDILDALKRRKVADVAKEYHCDRTTIFRIKQKEEELRKSQLSNRNNSKIRERQSSHPQVDAAMLQWFTKMREKNAIITGPLMLEKAAQFGISLAIEGFSPSAGWLSRFKIRNGVSFAKVYKY